MRDYFTVTVSDDLGSRYYAIRKVYRKIFIAAVLLGLLVLAVSVSLNYLQYQHANWLGKINRSADDQLVQLDAENRKLKHSLDVQRTQLEKISNELAEMEKISGVVSSHYDTGLVQRTGLLTEFYRQKVQPYVDTDSDSRPDVTEATSEPGAEGEARVVSTAADETAQVEPAGLTISHERILYDSIPGGYPTRSTTINSPYGKQRDPDSGITIFHKGVDLEVNEGDPVIATADGIVREADFSPATGNRIVVQHNFGFETRYGDIEQFNLAPGDVVLKGDRIGVAGSGDNDRAGLHYEIRYLGKSIDPREFLKWQFGSREIFSEVKGIKWPSLINLIDKQLPQNLELSHR